jgi:hypothetical protein
MFIQDLSTSAYFVHGENVRAVGWLEAEHPYQQGTVPKRFMTCLKHHVATACQVVLFCGAHRCSLCSKEARYVGYRNLMIPTKQLLYAAPELIVHYIEKHRYQPTQEFIDVVMACPKQGSDLYMALLLRYQECWRWLYRSRQAT